MIFVPGALRDPTQIMSFLDFTNYLPDDVLVKVDRASMAASLEVRAPFLDPALIEFALGVPPSLKLRGLTRKYLLRALMRGRIPDEIIDRCHRLRNVSRGGRWEHPSRTGGARR